jgi:Ca-activated chloride channel family protein
MAKSLHVQPDRTVLRAGGRTRRHLRVDVVAPRRPPRIPVNLALVLDRSGSMAGDKLELAREGAIRAVRSLRDGDRLSVLSYNESASVLIRSIVVDGTARRVAEDRLRRIEAAGNTDLCGGWLRGCEQVGMGLDPSRLGRCLLLTDGLANVGTTDPTVIVRHATELRRRGVTTSTLGVGRDFDEGLLRQMAEAGGGNFYFAEHPVQLSDYIAGETGEALKVVARDATLVVDLPEGVTLTSPNPFRVRNEPRRSVLELGDLVADQVLSLILTIEFPEGKAEDTALVQCWLWDPAAVLEGSVGRLFTYARSKTYESAPRDSEVNREAAIAYAAAARRRAAELGRRGAVAEGRDVLKKMAAHISRQAGGDAELLALASALEQEAAKLQQMDSLEYKRLEFSTFGALRSRGEDGMTIGTMSFTTARTLQLMTRAERRGHPQAPFYVVVVTSDTDASRLVAEVGRTLAAADPQAFAFTIVDGGARVLDVGPGAAFSRDDEFALAYAVTSAGEAPKIALVRGALADGASTRWFGDEGVTVVSLARLDTAAASWVQAFVAYQLVVQASRHRRPHWDPSSAVHPDRRGCWGDSAPDQAENESHLDTADLCAECRGIYERAGVDVEQLQRLLGVVRELAQRGAGVLK